MEMVGSKTAGSNLRANYHGRGYWCPELIGELTRLMTDRKRIAEAWGIEWEHLRFFERNNSRSNVTRYRLVR